MRVALLGLGVSGLISAIETFVPPHSQPFPTLPRRGAASGANVAAAAAAEQGEAGGAAPSKQYDWQRVAESQSGDGPLDLSDLPDLPGFDDAMPPADGGAVGTLKAGVTTREVELPELPGDPDILPPAPNSFTDGGLGLWQWTGIWLVGAVLIAVAGGVGSYALARAKIDPAFANQALSTCKLVFGTFQFLFFGRLLLTQFPRIKSTDMPWAPLHYSTEWILGPTRGVFPPEAGVDIAPILWLLVTLLASELITGPSGILQLAKDAPRVMPPGMTIR